MVTILLVIALLAVIAVAAGSSRRRAAERAGVDRERRVIARELGERRR